MKRIYLVGASDDKKRLQLAQGRGAKLPSMELPMSPKLRALLRDLEAERLGKQGKRLPEEELKERKAQLRRATSEAKKARAELGAVGESAREAERRARDAERRAAEAEQRAREAERRAAEAQRRAEEAERRATEAEKRAAEAASRVREQDEKREGRPARGGLAPGGFERATGVADMEGVHAIIRSRGSGPDLPARKPARSKKPAARAPGGEPQDAEGTGGAPEQEPEPRQEREPRRKKAPPMPEPKLTPAEIQTLLRAGRAVRSVAKQAEAPVDWVRRLAAPIESERLGVVTQLLQSYVVRARLGRSALPVGESIVENLRDRGFRFPERVAEDGWTAWRPDHREWRVRFAYESRGRKQRAEWRFDPQSRTVTPENDLAQELGFRAPPEADGVRRGGASSRKKPSRRKSAKKSAGKRSARR